MQSSPFFSIEGDFDSSSKAALTLFLLVFGGNGVCIYLGTYHVFGLWIVIFGFLGFLVVPFLLVKKIKTIGAYHIKVDFHDNYLLVSFSRKKGILEKSSNIPYETLKEYYIYNSPIKTHLYIKLYTETTTIKFNIYNCDESELATKLEQLFLTINSSHNLQINRRPMLSKTIVGFAYLLQWFSLFYVSGLLFTMRYYYKAVPSLLIFGGAFLFVFFLLKRQSKNKTN